MSPSLTLFFIVEPPTYQYLACYLAASIRNHLPSDVQIVGYCPEHRKSELAPSAVEALRRMGCELRFFDAVGKFDPAYSHGNKILACLEPRDTDFSGFMDSDILLLKDNCIENIVKPGCVCASPAASLRWGRGDMWSKIYDAFGMDVPTDRIYLMRDKRRPVVPYYSSGFVTFPEKHESNRGGIFPKVWYDTARTIDTLHGLENRRPYLDQMSLPVAIARSGLNWCELPPEQHYILGGVIRGQPLPKGNDIRIVHYRRWEVLKESGLSKQGYDELKRQIGVSRVAGVFSVNDKNEYKFSVRNETFDKNKSQLALSPPFPLSHQLSDPSRAGLAAVTMIRGDHFFLQRWVEYYGSLAGRENLYILRHGPDAEIDRIAAGANIVSVPVCDDMSSFDYRRWTALSEFASGLTSYYNWVLCNDVDELVAPDPATGQNLIEYLDGLFERGLAAQVISPFAVEVVHTPATEPEPIKPGVPLLSVRRNFRINSNYAKPCLIRRRVRFSSGGHGSDIRDVRLDPQLWLFHLRYVDDAISTERLLRRKTFAVNKASSSESTGRSRSTWDQGTSSFERLREMTPVAEQAEFPDVIERMVSGRQQASSGKWFFGNVRTRELYRLPERFSKLF